MLSNPYNTNNFLLSNPFMQNTVNGVPVRNTLALNQIDGFVPVPEFVDETNTKWTLCKAASNSMVDVPDPKSVQIVDYWCHDFPGLKTKLYVYVVEGVRQPRVETEQPTRVLYQWFSPTWVATFTPSMITDKEWLKANVYSAPVVSGRESKLAAICKLKGNVHSGAQADEDKLLTVEELNGHSQGNQVQG